MKKIAAIIISFTFYHGLAFSQAYTSYFTGNIIDSISSPAGGVCMMGGASENDQAMKWFLERANGGDIVVLRASGSDGYNEYFYSELGVSVNSVETIVFNSSAASTDEYIIERLSQAEAIWFAGGDQWNYISYWRGTPIDSVINVGLNQRNIAIGGTSAGMAIQGGYYFSAQNGTVTSAAALANPYNINVTVDSAAFLQNEFLENVITDTHYDNPDRKGRHVTFLARILTDYENVAMGIACDEYVAVCIDTTGLAYVYGEYPDYEDNAYFIQSNCELMDIYPENCSAGEALDWDLDAKALKVYHIKGDTSGVNYFDLNDWQIGAGGIWEDWYVDDGVLFENEGDAINCNALSIEELTKGSFQPYPNPSARNIAIELPDIISYNIIDQSGRICVSNVLKDSKNRLDIDVSHLNKGVYVIEVITRSGSFKSRFMKIIN